MLKLLFIFTILLQPKLDKVPRLFSNPRRNEFTIKNPLVRHISCSIECIGYEPFSIQVKPKSIEIFQLEGSNNEQAICFINDCV